MDDGITRLVHLGFYFSVKSNDNGPKRQVEVKNKSTKKMHKPVFSLEFVQIWR